MDGLELGGDGRDVPEELDRLADGHVEHIGDGLALVGDLERLAVVAGAATDLARDVDIGEEVHLDLDDAVAPTSLAAAAADVEGEAAGLVASHAGLGGLGEELADLVEDAGVGGGVRARRAADGRLVDVDDLVDVLDALDIVVLAPHGAGAVELVGEAAIEDLLHEGGLAGTGDAGEADEHAQGDGDIYVLEVVLAGAFDGEAVAVALAAVGHGD